MTCQYTDHVMLYWSGELGRRDAEQLEQHLTICRSCREMLHELQSQEQQFSALPVLTPRRDLVHAACEKQDAREARWSFWRISHWKIQFATTVTVVISLGLWYVLFKNPMPGQNIEQRTELSLAFRFEDTQMMDVQARMQRLKKRMGETSQKRQSWNVNASSATNVPPGRSHIQQIKARFVKSKALLFHKTFHLPRSQRHENSTLYRFNHQPYYAWAFRRNGLC